MAGASLLSLLDDIAALLDDVAILTRMAAQKTVGLVGDDIALNAEQVTGFSAAREIPVVWSVSKGSLLNKVILIPIALALNHFIPWAIVPLLIVGGTYLCYEGFHKVYHKLHDRFKPHDKEGGGGKGGGHTSTTAKLLAEGGVDLEAYEKKRIRGAIRTDFILSAEITVIALGTLEASTPLLEQLLVLSAIGFSLTIGVYGMVALIVKIDDLGLALIKKGGIWDPIGDALLSFAPRFMKLLGIVGTLAMFLVGGGIYVHNVEFLHHVVASVEGSAGVLTWITPHVADFVVGVLVGGVAMVVVSGLMMLRGGPEVHLEAGESNR